MLACGPGNAINNVFEPEWLRMATTKTRSDGDEDDTEDDNDTKADEYDDDDGDEKSVHGRHHSFNQLGASARRQS